MPILFLLKQGRGEHAEVKQLLKWQSEAKTISKNIIFYYTKTCRVHVD